MASEMKKSRRFAPYGDRAQIKTYKNIVPAPPKGVMDARPPEITQNIVIGPKRKREEEVQVSQYGERPGCEIVPCSNIQRLRKNNHSHDLHLPIDIQPRRGYLYLRY